MGNVSTWMGVRLSSRPGIGCMCLGIAFCCPTFLNTSALLVSLMALQLAHVDRQSFWTCFILSKDFHKLQHSVMSTCLITEVKQQWVTLVLRLSVSQAKYRNFCCCQTYISSSELLVSLIALQPCRLKHF